MKFKIFPFVVYIFLHLVCLQYNHHTESIMWGRTFQIQSWYRRWQTVFIQTGGFEGQGFSLDSTHACGGHQRERCCGHCPPQSWSRRKCPWQSWKDTTNGTVVTIKIVSHCIRSGQFVLYVIWTQVYDEWHTVNVEVVLSHLGSCAE